uniref:DUF5641 domain-containing protein n=1 Tax=Amphimedon queenslandica TaxID=400682 RepID=A0A1X7TNE3_AMPQE
MHTVNVGHAVIIHDDLPCGFWRLGIIEEKIKGRDKEVTGVVVRVGSGSQSSSFLRPPIQRLYPLEVRLSVSSNATPSSCNNQTTEAEDDTAVSNCTNASLNNNNCDPIEEPNIRPHCKAALKPGTR